MLIIFLAITVLFHISLTVGTIKMLKKFSSESPMTRPKIFLASSVVRIILSLIAFAVSIIILKEDMHQLKVFTIAFLIIYMVVLAFDTIYFYRSSESVSKIDK